MRKALLAIAFVLALGTVQAQATFGIHAAAILANGSYKEDNFSPSSENRFSWKAGFIANVPIADQCSFMPQLNLLSKGNKFTDGSDKLEFELTYLELPLNFVYNSNGFFAGLGPVLSYGLSGSATTESDSFDIKFDGDENANDDAFHLKGFEFGGDIIAGYKLPMGLFFNAHYFFSFSNISPYSDISVKNRYVGLGIGYFFGGGGGSSSK